MFCTTIFWICFHFFNFQQFSSPFVTHWDGGNFYHSRYLKTFLVQFYFMSAVSPCSFNLCCYWPNWKTVGHTTQKTETKLNGSIFVTMVMIWRNILRKNFEFKVTQKHSKTKIILDTLRFRNETVTADWN